MQLRFEKQCRTKPGSFARFCDPDAILTEQEAEGLEMTGTPYSDRWGEGQLVPRTIGKHHAAIMNMRFATIWLSHMVAAARYAH